MASENETVEEIANETKFAIDYGNGVLLDLAGKQVVGILDRIEAAHRREVAELQGALKKAYGTLYSISCSRYGEGLTCTDDIHEIVTMARECSDSLYANENIRKALEGEQDEGK